MHIKHQLSILKELEINPKTSQRQLSKNLGFSLGKVNFCLQSLIDKGLIKVENFVNNAHKLQYAYLLTPKGIKEKTILTKVFLKLKMAEYDELKLEIEYLKSEVKQ